ncbi:MAG: hypothetical protein K9N09_04415 [Candidatus Cloacimonetes bacterium]|nr:hypothetical protein [Candidatus Cloacimonadota bacterium]MCF7813608.1 hypothetical protein [Candidatus Cloacimonadota bacterium]MCF7867924.1 hypothetical protein [Candidatus Cloacimonadota bacterium]MCF7882883.1 hypothetical protein [Candidatus Cloacimonadota bacterium]
MNKKSRTITGSIIIIFLLIPLIAMQFTNEVDWSLTDFVIAAVLFLITGFVFYLILKKAESKRQKIIFSLVLLVIFLLIWAELAVGIF